MKKEVVKKIGKHQYTFCYMTPRESWPVFTWLLALVGDTAGRAAPSIKSWKDISGFRDLFNNANVDMGMVFKALGGAVGNLRDEKVIEHVEALLESVEHRGQRMNLDHVNFQAEMLHMLMVLKQAITVNFSDFFEGSEGLGSVIDQMNSQGSTSDTPTSSPSTGSSSDR